MSEAAMKTIMVRKERAAQFLDMSVMKFDSHVAGGILPRPRILGETSERWLVDELEDAKERLCGKTALSPARKAHITRKRRKDENEALRKEALIYAGGLKQQIETLEKQLSELQRVEALSTASATLTGHTLLREHEISEASEPWNEASGVYFLLDFDRVVYVGQSINVHNRISSHSDKNFNRYAYIPCPVDRLNVLESLYIHCLRPPLNASTLEGGKVAPVSLYGILGADVVEIKNAKATQKGKRK